MNPDTTTQPSQPAGIPPQGSPAPMTPMPEKKGMGGVIALVIIVLALLAGGYFLMQVMTTRPTMEVIEEGNVAPAPRIVPNDPTPQANVVDPNTVQGTGTSLSDIENDLNATDLDSLTADLNAI